MAARCNIAGLEIAHIRATFGGPWFIAVYRGGSEIERGVLDARLIVGVPNIPLLVGYPAHIGAQRVAVFLAESIGPGAFIFNKAILAAVRVSKAQCNGIAQRCIDHRARTSFVVTAGGDRFAKTPDTELRCLG